jgi:hypothetical protein
MTETKCSVWRFWWEIILPEKFHDIDLGNEFLNVKTPKTWATKAKEDCITLKSFLHSKRKK